MPHDGLASISYIGQERRPSLEAGKNQTHEEIRASFAVAAVEKIFEWLAYSPNNPRYLTSETYRLPKEWLERNAGMLEQTIESDVAKITTNNETIDLHHHEVIRDGVILHTNRKTGEIEPVAKMFVAQDFLEAGIKGALYAARHDTAESGVELINEHAVNAIRAMIVRGAYFEQLHQRNPEAFTRAECDSHLATFRQNIVATVFRAARLAQAASTATEQQPSQQASESEPVAA